MASIDNDLAQIRTAIYGEDMRRAIYNAVRKVNSQMDSDIVPNIDENSDSIREIRNEMTNVATNFLVDEEAGLLYLVNADGEPISDGVVAPSSGGGGGGGGGGSYSYIPRLTAIGDRTINVSEGTDIVISFTYTSVDSDGIDDGAGVGVISVGGATKRTFSVPQGNNSVDVTNFVSPGTNNLILRVENSEGVSKTLKYTITVRSLSISTTFDEIAFYNGDVSFNYTVVGTGTKTIHYLLDGSEIDTETTTSSGRSRTYLIPAQSHGSHSFEVYVTSEEDGAEVESNHIVMAMVWVDSSNSTPIIATSFVPKPVTQGDTVSIPYLVYDPANEIATVSLSIIDSLGTVYSTTTTTRGRDKSLDDPWTVRDYPAGNTVFRISCRDVNYDITIPVTEYVFPIDEIEDALIFKFSPAGRTNGEANPESWSYGEGASKIEATFSGFGWTDADGWLQDSENSPILRFIPGNSMIIPERLFATDARETGFTIEAEFATRDVRDYESVILSCIDNGRGFKIASQNAALTSEQSSISILFNEAQHLRVTFAVEQRNLNRLIYIYVNGIMCGVKQYPVDDNFAQSNPVGLTIGAESCGIDLYSIRCYRKGLNRSEQLENFIVDRGSLSDRQNAYLRNNILNDSEEVDIEKLPATLPYVVISMDELPQYKGDKKKCTMRFVDPSSASKSFVSEQVDIDVQGTSSSVYPVKNLKLKVKNGFRLGTGETVSAYAIHDGEMPIKTFCIKVDYASSEGANNVELVQLYEEICREQDFLIPPQEDDTKVRQGISGRPIALFWEDTVDNVTTFIGKGNLNWDKSDREGFGFDKYPNSESIEFKNNTSDRCLGKSADFVTKTVDQEGKEIFAWENDFEYREPDGGMDTTRFKRVWDFVVAHDRSKALSDEAKATMLADFKTHFTDYFVKDNMLFYYLFTEFFLMVDSRAKNMFLTTYDGTHWLPLPYDFDTALGIECWCQV